MINEKKDIYPGDRVTVDIRLIDVEVVGTEDEPAIEWPTGRWLLRGHAVTVVGHWAGFTPPEGWEDWEWLSITTPSRGAMIFHREDRGHLEMWRQLNVDPEARTVWGRDEMLRTFGTGRWEEGEYRTKRGFDATEALAAGARITTIGGGGGGGAGSGNHSGATGIGKRYGLTPGQQVIVHLPGTPSDQVTTGRYEGQVQGMLTVNVDGGRGTWRLKPEDVRLDGRPTSAEWGRMFTEAELARMTRVEYLATMGSMGEPPVEYGTHPPA